VLPPIKKNLSLGHDTSVQERGQGCLSKRKLVSSRKHPARHAEDTASVPEEDIFFVQKGGALSAQEDTALGQQEDIVVIQIHDIPIPLITKGCVSRSQAEEDTDRV